MLGSEILTGRADALETAHSDEEIQENVETVPGFVNHLAEHFDEDFGARDHVWRCM